MTVHWALLPATEVRIFRTTVAFLEGRLGERLTLEWALRLSERDAAKRLAVLEVLNRRSDDSLTEPWRTAWRLVEESWNDSREEDSQSTLWLDIHDRVKRGERSGALIEAIVSLVRPGVKVGAFTHADMSLRSLPKRPRTIHDLMAVNLTSGGVVDPAEIGVTQIEDVSLLAELAQVLDAAVLKGLAIANRIHGDSSARLWRLGDLRRVYFVPPALRREEEHDPDEFHHGIAPAVKLLHAVVERLRGIDVKAALFVVRRWRETHSPIHVRLWATMARDPKIASDDDVTTFLRSSSDREFWDLHLYPEVAELRALRFMSLPVAQRQQVVARLRKGPPRAHWPAKADADRVADARLYSSVRELKRIRVAGGSLSPADEGWLAEQLSRFADLASMNRIDEGFPVQSKAQWVAPNPDERYDFLRGSERLQALETALATQRATWEDDPARGASDWIGAGANTQALLADLEAAPDAGSPYPHIWDRFGWTHSRSPSTEERSAAEFAEVAGSEPSRVLTLLSRLQDGTTRRAIEGIAHWLGTWAQDVGGSQQFAAVWLRLWPIAVEATNAQQAEEVEPSLSVVAPPPGSDEPKDLDTLNTPTGKLVGAFLSVCPSIKAGDKPFEDTDLRAMRDAAMSAHGRSLLVVQHRFVEQLAYFLMADKGWTHAALIGPLLEASNEALILWRAVARKVRHKNVLSILGEAFAQRASDLRLGRETRQSLSFSVIVDSLQALRQEHEPAIPFPAVQQMIRSLDDEVRAYAADAVRRYVQEMAKATGGEGQAAALFFSAAQPFLQNVWPQERSLATPGVARAFARLPATCGDAFANAVDEVERFLVPFDSWSLVDYGLYGQVDGVPKVERVNSASMAQALLRLLNATVGTSEGAIVPSDIGVALDRISEVAPKLSEAQAYRRLAALARR